MVSVAVACLPTAVSLLLLEALFMQISGVSLALTWPRRLCLFRALLCRSLCYRLSPFQALGKVTLHPRCQACVFIYSSRQKWVPSSPVQFSSHHHFHKLSCSWLLGGAAAPASLHVCLQFTWEVGLPSSPVEFFSLCHSHQLSHSWLLGVHPMGGILCYTLSFIVLFVCNLFLTFRTCFVRNFNFFKNKSHKKAESISVEFLQIIDPVGQNK
jgi:hypothetical protein